MVRKSVFQGNKIIFIVIIFCKKIAVAKGKKLQERMRMMNNELESDAMGKMETMEIRLLLEEKIEVTTI